MDEEFNMQLQRIQIQQQKRFQEIMAEFNLSMAKLLNTPIPPAEVTIYRIENGDMVGTIQ